MPSTSEILKLHRWYNPSQLHSMSEERDWPWGRYKISDTYSAIAYDRAGHYPWPSLTEYCDTCNAWIARLALSSHDHPTTAASHAESSEYCWGAQRISKPRKTQTSTDWVSGRLKIAQSGALNVNQSAKKSMCTLTPLPPISCHCGFHRSFRGPGKSFEVPHFQSQGPEGTSWDFASARFQVD